MKNIYMTDISHNYYVDIAKELIVRGSKIKVIETSPRVEYWPQSLDEFIRVHKPKVVLWDDFNSMEKFLKILDPDYSFMSYNNMSKLSYYEKMFLMSTDRLSLLPISQIDRIRLFYRFVGHFYKILKNERIDIVLSFGIPHGLSALALFGIAKVIGLKTIFTNPTAVAPELSLIENDIKNTSLDAASLKLKSDVLKNEIDESIVNEIVEKFRKFDYLSFGNSDINVIKSQRSTLVPFNRHVNFIKKIFSLILKKPFSEYYNPEFFLKFGIKTRILRVIPLIKYYIQTLFTINFYNKYATDKCDSGNSLVFFLQFQPEASTMPQGGIFADQLLALDLILQAVPKDMTVYVKEHPYMFCQFGQDAHERSVRFYKYILRDPRVYLVKKNYDSIKLIKKVKYVVSINGSISMEAILQGKPCIIFGRHWIDTCASCFVVDSVETLKKAFNEISKKSPSEVFEDTRNFYDHFRKKVIFAAAYSHTLPFIGNDLTYDKSVNNLSNAISKNIGLS
jgi:hypothetical protein